MSSVNLKSIKDGIKTLLDAANQAGGVPIDLSTNMTNRVRKVLTLNVEKIPIQPSYFPCVTIFFKGKGIELYDIAKNQYTGRRTSIIDISIVGLVWIDNMNTANFDITDLADNECEYLMENIEEVLRNDPTLSGTVLTSKPTSVTYHNFVVAEDAHMRAGIMNLQARAHY